MRDLLMFILFLAVIFFVVGEWRGWNLGVPAQTPVLAYKTTSVTRATRRTINTEAMRVQIDGRVRNGSVTVRVRYTDTGSFQTMRAAGGAEEVFEEVYNMGQSIAINEVFEEGQGQYQVVMEFDNATGIFNVDLPRSSEL